MRGEAVKIVHPLPWTVSTDVALLDANGKQVDLTNRKVLDYIAKCASADPWIRERLQLYKEALEEIAKGEGAFSRDPAIHAANCVEHAVLTATAALGMGGDERNES